MNNAQTSCCGVEEHLSCVCSYNSKTEWRLCVWKLVVTYGRFAAGHPSKGHIRNFPALIVGIKDLDMQPCLYIELTWRTWASLMMPTYRGVHVNTDTQRSDVLSKDSIAICKTQVELPAIHCLFHGKNLVSWKEALNRIHKKGRKEREPVSGGLGWKQ